MLFFFFFSCVFSLSCNVGTNDAYSSQTCTPGLTCIKAYLLTGALPTWNVSQVNGGNGTEVYACGNCTYYQVTLNNTVVHSVSCCDTNDCFVPNAPSPVGTCDSITTRSSCVNMTDCYWCDSFMNNSFGLCKSLGTPYLPCFGQGSSMFSPPPICMDIGCAPPPVPYFAQQLTFNFLLDFGMPPVSSTPPSVSRNPFEDLALQLIGAEASGNVRYLNDTNAFCQIDQELQEWCGINNDHYPNAFQYCLVTERWPQPDVFGWIQNTTFTNNRGMQVIFPAICVCQLPGYDANGMPLGPAKAYFVPNNVRPQPFFAPPCGAEKALLAFYILLIFATALGSLYVLFDTVVLVQILISGKEKREFGTKTLFVKIILFCWFLVAIPGMVLFIVPQASPEQTVASYLLKLLSIIFFIFGFSTAIFTYVEIVLASKVFGKHPKKILALRFSIVFFILNFFVLLACMFLLSSFGYFLLRLLSGNVTGYTQIVDYSQKLSNLAKPFMYLLVIEQAIVTVCCLALVMYIISVILGQSANLTKQKAVQLLLVRAISLMIAVFVSVPNLAILAFQVYLFGYVFTQSVMSPWPTEYTTNYAFLWFIWGEYVTELLSVLCVAYSMTTVVKRSIINRLAGKWFGYSVSNSTDSSSTDSRSDSNSKMDSRRK